MALRSLTPEQLCLMLFKLCGLQSYCLVQTASAVQHTSWLPACLYSRSVQHLMQSPCWHLVNLLDKQQRKHVSCCAFLNRYRPRRISNQLFCWTQFFCSVLAAIASDTLDFKAIQATLSELPAETQLVIVFAEVHQANGSSSPGHKCGHGHP